MNCKMSCEFDREKRRMDRYDFDMHDMPLAMSYVPWQRWENVMEADAGLEAGTIFADLVLPFHGEKAFCGRNRERRPSCNCNMQCEKSTFTGRGGSMRNMNFMDHTKCDTNMDDANRMNFANSSNEGWNMRGRRCNRI